MREIARRLAVHVARHAHGRSPTAPTKPTKPPVAR
jgi:hypothetical protein